LHIFADLVGIQLGVWYKTAAGPEAEKLATLPHCVGRRPQTHMCTCFCRSVALHKKRRRLRPTNNAVERNAKLTPRIRLPDRRVTY